jgi:hypothetical protein
MPALFDVRVLPLGLSQLLMDVKHRSTSQVMVPTYPLEAFRVVAWSHVQFEETHPIRLG